MKCVCVCVCQLLSHVRLFVTLSTRCPDPLALPCPLLLPVPKTATDRPRGLGRCSVWNQAMSPPPPPGRRGPSDDPAPSSGERQHPPRQPGKAWPVPQGTPSPAPPPPLPRHVRLSSCFPFTHPLFHEHHGCTGLSQGPGMQS